MIITVTSDNKTWYLLGTILFAIIGAVLAFVGFLTSAGVGLAVVGIVIAVAAVVLMVDTLIQ